MSHMATVECHITDLDALEAACKESGLELIRNTTSFKWWGRVIGDSPMPEGFTAADMGKCEHCVRVPGSKEAYEIGVVARRDGKPGYVLMYDNWQQGYGLEAKAGKGCGKLTQAYACQVAVKQARRQGYSVQRKQLADGRVQLVCRK